MDKRFELNLTSSHIWRRKCFRPDEDKENSVHLLEADLSDLECVNYDDEGAEYDFDDDQNIEREGTYETEIEDVIGLEAG